MSAADLPSHVSKRNTWGAIGDLSALITAAPSILNSNYVLQASDNGLFFRIEGSSAITITVPNFLPAGFNVGFVQYGTGVATISAGSGATKRGNGSTTTQYVFVNAIVIRNNDGATAEFILPGGA